MIIQRTENGLVATVPFVVTCGCGSVVPDTRSKLKEAGCPDVAMLVSTGNENAKRYLQDRGITKLVPSLERNKHSVLFNPLTGEYIDLLMAKRSDTLSNNIYRVVHGGV